MQFDIVGYFLCILPKMQKFSPNAVSLLLISSLKTFFSKKTDDKIRLFSYYCLKLCK